MKTHLLLAVALTALPAAVLAATLTDDRYGPPAISDSASASDAAVQTASPAASPAASGYHGRFLSWANKSPGERTDHAAIQAVLAPPAAPPPVRIPARAEAPAPRPAEAPASLSTSAPAIAAAIVVPARRDPAPLSTAALQPIIVAPNRAPRPVQVVAKPVSNHPDHPPAAKTKPAPAPSVAVAKTSPQPNPPASTPPPQHVAVVNRPPKPSRPAPVQAPRKLAVAKASPSAKPAVSKADVAAPLPPVATAAPATPAPVKTPAVVVANASPAPSKPATASHRAKPVVVAVAPKDTAKAADVRATASQTPAPASPPVALAQAWPSASAQGPVKARFYSLHRAYGDQPDAIPMPVDRPPVLVGPGDSAPAAEASDQESEGKADKTSPSGF
jgi:hypothetical protein